jgi:hypothetical protein
MATVYCLHRRLLSGTDAVVAWGDGYRAHRPHQQLRKSTQQFRMMWRYSGSSLNIVAPGALPFAWPSKGRDQPRVVKAYPSPACGSRMRTCKTHYSMDQGNHSLAAQGPSERDQNVMAPSEQSAGKQVG